MADRTCPTCQSAIAPDAHFCQKCGTATPTEPGVPERMAPTGTFEVSRVRSALADRYKIEKVLGEGGMATVYLAEDLKHKRKVAVKVMRPELAETLGTERFLREVEIAARLSHPNILPVHDSGNAGGILYYVMPLVEGESLPDRLRREKQLPLSEALRLAREVAEALAYAHAQGIVHRDIKPANILISAGHALVADFGIARATSGGGPALTQTGLAIGTPQYMSPEQASGDSGIDGRTDIYALGCVLYEMIAGEPPFTGPTAQVIISRSITEAPRPLEQTRTAIPAVVGSAVLRALAKTPADRYATGHEMATALLTAEETARTGSGAVAIDSSRRGFRPWQIGLAALALLAVGVLGNRLISGNGSTVTATAGKRVAVMPFENLGAAEDAYLADGIVDELRGKLAKIPQLTVIASASTDQYRETTKSGPEIAKELRVDQVLMGKVQWAPVAGGGRKVRVSAELVNGQSGEITWRDTFDADMTDVFEMQSLLATRVAGALGAALQRGDTTAAEAPPTTNTAAYDLYLKARAINSNAAGNVRIAVGYLETAVALDSNFAQAWSLLGSQLSTLYYNGTRDLDVGRRAKLAVERGLVLAPGQAISHRAAANYHENVEANVEARDREINRALELAPNDAGLLAWSADIDFRAERFDAVFKKLSRARELDPRAVGVLNNLIRAQVYLRRLDEAKASGEELLALQPTTPGPIEWGAGVHFADGDLAAGQRVVQSALERIPVTDLVTYFAGYNEMAFALGKDQLDLLFRLPPAAFDDDRAWWGQALSIAARQQGDMVRAKAYADSSLALSKQQSDANPADVQLRALYAVMLAYAGRTAEAITEVERANADATQNDNNNVPYAEMQRVRVYLAAGNQEKALDAIERLLQMPYHVTPGWLKVDPTFAPLKDNPRFKRLLVGGMKAPLDG